MAGLARALGREVAAREEVEQQLSAVKLELALSKEQVRVGCAVWRVRACGVRRHRGDQVPSYWSVS